jgi:hypothetical protein
MVVIMIAILAVRMDVIRIIAILMILDRMRFASGVA